VKDAKYVAEEADRKYDEVKNRMQHENEICPCPSFDFFLFSPMLKEEKRVSLNGMQLFVMMSDYDKKSEICKLDSKK
jgi:hypothetical protein